MDLALVAGIDPFSDRASGIRTHVLGLADSLAGLGHDVCIVGSGPGAASDRAPWRFLSVTDHPFPSSFEFLSALIVRAPRLPIGGRTLHVHRPDDLLAFSSRRDLRGRVLTLHGLSSVGIRQRHGRLTAVIYRGLERIAVRRADCLVVLDSATKGEIEESFPEARDHIVMGSAGVDLDRFHPIRRGDARARLGVDDCRTVAFVGRLAPEKNVELLLEAMSKLEEAQFLVAGDGPLLPTLKKWGRRRPRFHYLGQLGHDDVAVVLNAADVVALPSKREAMPSICLESLACGTPVVATRVGGVGDLIHDGVNGFFASPDPDSLASALRLAIDRSDDMRSACRSSVLRFGWRAVAAAMVRTYREAAG